MKKKLIVAVPLLMMILAVLCMRVYTVVQWAAAETVQWEMEQMSKIWNLEAGDSAVLAKRCAEWKEKIEQGSIPLKAVFRFLRETDQGRVQAAFFVKGLETCVRSLRQDVSRFVCPGMGTRLYGALKQKWAKGEDFRETLMKVTEFFETAEYYPSGLRTFEARRGLKRDLSIDEIEAFLATFQEKNVKEGLEAPTKMEYPETFKLNDELESLLKGR